MTKVELLEDLHLLEDRYWVNSTWQHYKGGIYKITGHIFDTNIDDWAILYHRIDGPDFNSIIDMQLIYSRPEREWEKAVKLPNGQVTKRFVRVVKKPVWIRT